MMVTRLACACTLAAVCIAAYGCQKDTNGFPGDGASDGD